MRDFQTIGIIGTGQLAEYIITGIHKVNAPYEFIVSPRSKAVSLNLKDRFRVKIAKDNQDVINNSDWVFLGVLPEVGVKILPKLIYASILN